MYPTFWTKNTKIEKIDENETAKPHQPHVGLTAYDFIFIFLLFIFIDDSSLDFYFMICF